VETKNPTKRILIVGAGEAGRRLAEALENQPGQNCEVVGFVEDELGIVNGSKKRVLGRRDELLDLVERFNIDEVIVAYAPSWQDQVIKKLFGNGHSDIKVRVIPSMYELLITKPVGAAVDDVPLVDLTLPNLSRWYALLKRGFDIVFSIIALIAAVPILLAAAAAIKLTSRGPVLFRQERVGLNGTTFQVLKLRTMVQDAEKNTGPVLSSGRDDERVTPVGRILRATRIDEIPQFVNVLLGHMSVVGPRPERPCFVEEYRKRIPYYDLRHRVRPGITGLAQVNGYYLTCVYVKLKYDLMYLRNISLWLDLKILLKTAIVVLRSKGS